MSALPRLQKIVANGMDSVGNFHAGPLSFQFFNYDVNGRLVSIRDSSEEWRHWYTGPQPWLLQRKLLSVAYDPAGKLVAIKSTRDSFVYNSNNQLVTKLRRIYNDTSEYFVVNRFSYDAKGNLVTDSGYFQQSHSKPEGVLYGYDQYTYDDRGNVIRNDRVDLWPTGTVKRSQYTAAYDTQVNPYKSFGLLPYFLFYDHGFFLSANNKTEPGFAYEYYANGLLKKITYQGYAVEFYYE